MGNAWKRIDFNRDFWSFDLFSPESSFSFSLEMNLTPYLSESTFNSMQGRKRNTSQDVPQTASFCEENPLESGRCYGGWGG